MGACSTLYGASGQLDSIQEVMEANAAGKAAGQQLLQQLPWQITMRARLRSLTLLGIIAAAFWVRENACACVLLRRVGLQSEVQSSACHHTLVQPTVWSVAATCAAHYTWNWGVAAWRDLQLKQGSAKKWQQNGTGCALAGSHQAPAAGQQHDSSRTQRHNAQPVGTAIVTGVPLGNITLTLLAAQPLLHLQQNAPVGIHSLFY